ncbi:MAG: hypothetical protein ACK4UJ_00060 [Leptonema sp. (in: bacteria)]
MLFLKKFLYIILFITLFCTKEKQVHKQIHIDLSLENDSFYNFVRMVYFPEKKTTLFLFYNPLAIIDPRITEENINDINKDFFYNSQKQNLSEKIAILNTITGKTSDITISFTKESFIRLLNFSEGLNLFLPKKLELKESEYYFKEGFHSLFGENAYEFISLLEPTQEENKDLILLYRHLRWETLLLNFFYQLKFKPKLIKQENQIKYLYSFLNTNTNIETIKNIFSSIGESKFFLIEFPLIAKQNFSSKETLFFLNIKKTQNLYNSFVSNLSHIENQNTRDSIYLEILNANGTDRLANRVKMRIHSEQFKVLNTDNFYYTIPYTILLCNFPNGFEIQKIQNLLSLKENQIYFYRMIQDIPYSLILGKDFSIKSLLKK